MFFFLWELICELSELFFYTRLSNPSSCRSVNEISGSYIKVLWRKMIFIPSQFCMFRRQICDICHWLWCTIKYIAVQYCSASLSSQTGYTCIVCSSFVQACNNACFNPSCTCSVIFQIINGSVVCSAWFGYFYKSPTGINFILYPIPFVNNFSLFPSLIFLQTVIPCLYHHTILFYIYYKTIILPVVLYGCGTWSLTLRQEHRLKVFENRFQEEDIWTEEGWGDGRMEKTA
jgi:hypothetical protein